MTVENKVNGTEVAQSGPEKVGRLGKSHVDYWKPRLKKRAYEWEGKTVEIPDWQVRIAHLGRREWFNLGTPNKANACVMARDIHLSLISQGWAGTLAKFKPDMVVDSKVATVGEYLEQVKALGGLRQGTFEIYGRKFRTLVAGVFGINGGKEKYDYVNGGRAKWLARVNRVCLNRLTAKRIEAWKLDYLKQAEAENPLAYKRAKITLNSIVRASKALFTSDMLKKMPAKLPSPLPFDGVQNISVERSRYKSTFQVNAIVAAANRELAHSKGDTAADDRECFKILLLALGAGLRRDEIDTLTWKQIDFARHKINVETTIHTGAKSHDSENEVDVEPALLRTLKSYLRCGTSEFVINSPIQPRSNTAYHHYRCDRHFGRLIKWLRTKGVTGQKPLHTLRKEYGSQIAAQSGIFAASLALRHSDIQLTRDYYLDKKVPVFFKMSRLLKSKAA
jgi:integrase